MRSQKRLLPAIEPLESRVTLSFIAPLPRRNRTAGPPMRPDAPSEVRAASTTPPKALETEADPVPRDRNVSQPAGPEVPTAEHAAGRVAGDHSPRAALETALIILIGGHDPGHAIPPNAGAFGGITTTHAQVDMIMAPILSPRGVVPMAMSHPTPSIPMAGAPRGVRQGEAHADPEMGSVAVVGGDPGRQGRGPGPHQGLEVDLDLESGLELSPPIESRDDLLIDRRTHDETRGPLSAPQRDPVLRGEEVEAASVPESTHSPAIALTGLVAVLRNGLTSRQLLRAEERGRATVFLKDLRRGMRIFARRLRRT